MHRGRSSSLADAAERIGHRLCAAAQWRGDVCSWQIRVTSQSAAAEDTEAAGSSLYNGAAGISIFLAELYARTGAQALRRCAIGGLYHALNVEASKGQATIGAYSGSSGVAFAAYRCSELLVAEELREPAKRLLERTALAVRQDRHFDVISGAAGALLVFLRAANMYESHNALEHAVACGTRLLQCALRLPGGWGWPGMHVTRPLTGYSHGTAGIGLALLELATVTDAPEFHDAAEQAFAYEDAQYDSALRNWRDFRHPEIGKIAFQRGSAAVQAAAREMSLDPDVSNRGMLAWCHGAPGIALARVRASELRRDGAASVTLQFALEETERVVREARLLDFSLCHGVAGNCDILLSAARASGDSGLRELVQETLEEGVARFEASDRPWPSGVHRGYSDPSLLLGDAGIGYTLLRTLDASVPSMLHLSTGVVRRGVDRSERKVNTSHSELLRYQPELLKFAESKGLTHTWISSATALPGTRAHAFVAAARGHVAELDDACGFDALQFAEAREDLLGDRLNFVADFLQVHGVQSLSVASLDEVQWSLSHRLRVVRTKAALCDGDHSHSGLGDEYHLVLRSACDVRVTAIKPFSALVLLSFTTSKTLSEVCEELKEQVSVVDPVDFRKAVAEQIERAVHAGLIVPSRLVPQSHRTSDVATRPNNR